MCRTSDATTYSITVLVALRTMLRKIDASAKHSTNVGVSLIETLLHDRIYKRAAMEEHSFTRLRSILISYLVASVCISVPELTILHLLDANYVVPSKVAARVSAIPMLSDCGLHLLFNSQELFVVGQEIHEDCEGIGG